MWFSGGTRRRILVTVLVSVCMSACVSGCSTARLPSGAGAEETTLDIGVTSDPRGIVTDDLSVTDETSPGEADVFRVDFSDPDDLDVQAVEDAADVPAPAGRSRDLLTWTSRSTPIGTRHRLRLIAGTRIVEWKLDAEQDPGERWRMSPGKMRFGFDHSTAYVRWKPAQPVSLTAGTYRVAFGQGLVQSAPGFGTTMGGSSVSPVLGYRSGTGAIRPYAGADEDRYLSGVAIDIDLGGIAFGGFLSHRRFDAVIDTTISFDSPGPVDWQDPENRAPFLRLEARLRPGGDHVSATSRQRRGALAAGTVGGFARFRSGPIELAVFHRRDEADIPLILPTRGTELPRGRHFASAVSLRFVSRTVHVGGEWAVTPGGRASMLATRIRVQGIRLTVAARKYDRSFGSLYGSPPSFRTGAAGNEYGFSWTLSARPAQGRSVQIGYDAGCRLHGENDRPFGGCRYSASLQAEVTTPSSSQRLSVQWVSDRVAFPDDGNGTTQRRLSFSARTRRDLVRGISLVAGVRLRRRLASAADRKSNPVDSAISMELRIDRSRLCLIAGIADFRAIDARLAVYETPIGLSPGLRTLSGDGSTLHLGLTFATHRMLLGIGTRRTIDRRPLLVPGAESGTVFETTASISARIPE